MVGWLVGLFACVFASLCVRVFVCLFICLFVCFVVVCLHACTDSGGMRAREQFQVHSESVRRITECVHKSSPQMLNTNCTQPNVYS